MTDSLFYVLATMLFIFSALAVSLPNLLHAAISLIGAFFVTAALYIMLQLEFVALAQIMLYIGGIVIFMLIIILLTSDLGLGNRYTISNRRRLTGAGVSAVLLFGLTTTLHSKPSAVLVENIRQPSAVTIDDIGLRLLSSAKDGFIVPFEIISFLLLTALVGAVVIARRDNGATSPSADSQEERA